jgi:hypothetical protein
MAEGSKPAAVPPPPSAPRPPAVLLLNELFPLDAPEALFDLEDGAEVARIPTPDGAVDLAAPAVAAFTRGLVPRAFASIGARAVLDILGAGYVVMLVPRDGAGVGSAILFRSKKEG